MAFTNPILPIPIFHLSFSIFIFHFLFYIFHFSFFDFPFFIFHFSFLIFHFLFPIFHFPFFILHFSFLIFHFPFFIFHFSFTIFHFPFFTFHFPFSIFHLLFFILSSGVCNIQRNILVSIHTLNNSCNYFSITFYYLCMVAYRMFFPTYLLFTLSRSVMYITSYQIHSLYSLYTSIGNHL